SSGSASGIIFRKSTFPMDVLDASRSRPDVFSKLYCGYSTPARSGTCCRRAIRTTNPFIRTSPLCVFCLARGIVTPAVIADHIEPHRGDRNKFILGPLQSLCRECH